MVESRQIAWPAYLVAIAMIVIPLAEVATQLYPWRFLEARWRFGAVGLVSNAMLIPMPGLLIAFLTATVLEHRITRRIIGGIGLLAAIVCVGALILFALDAVQTRAGVRPELRMSFNVASIAAVIKTVVAGATFLAIGLAALRGRRFRAPEVGESDVPLFSVGSPAVKPRR